MSKQAIDFDENTHVIVSEYDQSAQLALPGYEAMHTMAFACLKSRLPEVANLLVVGAGTGFEIAKYGKAKSNWQILGVDPYQSMTHCWREEWRSPQTWRIPEICQVRLFSPALIVIIIMKSERRIIILWFLPKHPAQFRLRF